MSIVSEAVVRVVPTPDVKRGDTIWAHDDGDWFDVDRVLAGNWETVFKRRDGSIAEFGNLHHVLVKVAAA